MSDLFDVWRDWVVEHAAPNVCAGTLLVFMFPRSLLSVARATTQPPRAWTIRHGVPFALRLCEARSWSCDVG